MSKNFADSTVATAPSPASTGTSLVVQSGHGTKFYAGKAILAPAGVRPSTSNSEVVLITAISTDTLTITRIQESSSARTVIVGDLIYQGLTAAMLDSVLLGNNSLVNGEIPSGSINSSNTTFTLASAYVPGSVAFYIDGIRQRITTDYTETTPASGILTAVVAPAFGQSIRIDYLKSINATGNADTVDGYHANSTPTAGQLLPLNGSAVFPSAALGGAFTAFTPSWTNLSVGNGSTSGYYYMLGKLVIGYAIVVLGTTSTVGTAAYFATPVTASTRYITTRHWMIGGGWMQAGGNNFAAQLDLNGGTGSADTLMPFTPSGSPPSFNGTNTTSTYPATWGNGNWMSFQFMYEAA